MTRSSVEADEVALEAWRSTIPCIYNAIENDDLVIIDGIPEDDSSDEMSISRDRRSLLFGKQKKV